MWAILCGVLGLLVVSPGGQNSRAPGKDNSAKVRRVPYRLASTSHIIVRAKLNGKGPYNFILDTGAPTLYVATAVARQVGAKPNSQGWATFDRLDIEGGVSIPKARGRIEDPFQLEGMNGLQLAGVELHGMIGYTILARYRITFDFSNPKMVWELLDYQPPAPAALGGLGAPAGLDALGGILKFLGALLGKKPEPVVVLRGFLGLQLEEEVARGQGLGATPNPRPDDALTPDPSPLTTSSIIVKAVLHKSPAAVAGVKPGDRIRRFQAKDVGSIADLQRLADQMAPGELVQLEVVREGAKKTITIRAGRGF